MQYFTHLEFVFSDLVFHLSCHILEESSSSFQSFIVYKQHPSLLPL